jgi:hypothetical protein
MPEGSVWQLHLEPGLADRPRAKWKFEFLFPLPPPHSQQYSPATSLGGIITACAAPAVTRPRIGGPMPLHKSNSRPRWRAVLPLAAIIPSILAFCLSIPGAARTKVPPWIAKDWRQWSDDDCDAVLNNSPWGQMASTGGYASTSGPNVSSVVVATVQLRSALPIRQALLRKQQLLSFYSRMKRDKKQDFDRAHLHDLDPTSQVLIYIANSSSTTLPPGGSGSLTYQAPASPAAQPALQLADGTTIRPTEATIFG